MKFLLPQLALSINAYKVAALNDWSIEHVAKTNISFPGIAQAEADYCAGWKMRNPKDEEYISSRIGFNNAVNEDILPETIFYPDTIYDAKNVLNVSFTLLENSDGQVCVRACGNSFAGLSSACHNGIIIDLSNLSISGQTPDILYNEFTGEVTVGASVKQEELHNFLSVNGKSLPFSALPGICVSGFSLGGGFSDIGRAYGLACDHLIELSILLPDWQKVVVATSNNEFKDLFWASCGGGGIGVITSMTFKTFDEPQVLRYDEVLAISDLQPVLTWWNSRYQLQGIDPEKISLYIGMSSYNHEMADIKLVYPLPLGKDPLLAKSSLELLLESFWPKKKGIVISRSTFTEYSLQEVSTKSRDPRCNFWGRHKSQFYKHITMDEIKLLSKHMMKKDVLPSFAVVTTRRVTINAWGGMISNEINRDTAFWGRDAGFEMNLEVEFDPRKISTIFEDSICNSKSMEDEIDAVCKSNGAFNLKRWAEGWLHITSTSLCYNSGDPLCKFSFINHVSEFSFNAESYFGDHLARLRRIKHQFDPNNILFAKWGLLKQRSFSEQKQIEKVGTLDEFPRQLLGYLPLYDALPSLALLQKFNIIFLFAATTLKRYEQDDGTVAFLCTSTCDLGFADSTKEKFAEYAQESNKHARSGVLLTVGGHAMNGCWEFCYGKEDKLAESISGYVYDNELAGFDLNIEESPSTMMFQFVETLVKKTHRALTLKNSNKRWIISFSPIAHHMDISINTAESDYFKGLDYTSLFQRLNEEGYLSFIFVQYYNSWPVAAIQKNEYIEGFIGHIKRLQEIFGSKKLVLGMCTGICYNGLVEDADAVSVLRQIDYYSENYGSVGVGLWKITEQGAIAIVQHLFEHFHDIVAVPFNKQQQRVTFSVSSILVLVIVLVIVFVMIFLNQGSSSTSTWDSIAQERIINSELPGSLPVFIPMYNESKAEVEKTCANFREDTIANLFIRNELMLYFVVDNTHNCNAVKTVLQIAGLEIKDSIEEYPLQLDVPYCAGNLYGVPFKIFFKGDCKNPDIKKGKRFSAVLFAELVEDDKAKVCLKPPWAALCLDADVVTFPYSIEYLVLQLQKDEKITMTCGNILPSIDQTSVAARVQAAEYFLQNQVVKSSESLFGVVSCCPGAFLLIKFDAFQMIMESKFSKDTESSNCLVRNALDLGEDRFLTTLLLIQMSKWTSFMPAANCTTAVPDSFMTLAKQRRRWFNSSFANDIYIFMHLSQMVRSMIKQDKTKFRIISLLRSIYLTISTLIRLSGALLSVMLSILLMAKISYFFPASTCSGYFCNYYTFVVCFTLWATLLLYTFHQSAENSTGFFARNDEVWLMINLGIATLLLACGVIAILMYGEWLQAQAIIVFTSVLFGIFILIMMTSAEHLSIFGLQMVLSCIVYFVLGLPFLAFIQPLIAFSQIDNFNWGTRDNVESIEPTSAKNHAGSRYKEKCAFIVIVYTINGSVFLGMELLNSELMLKFFSYAFIGALLLQVLFATIHNINLRRKSQFVMNKN